LKRLGMTILIPRPTSPPARGRGLKRDPPLVHEVVRRVAPRAGAWIETRR